MGSYLLAAANADVRVVMMFWWTFFEMIMKFAGLTQKAFVYISTKMSMTNLFIQLVKITLGKIRRERLNVLCRNFS